METPSVRRAAVLLARIRQDGQAEGEIAVLEREMSELWRAVAAGEAALGARLDRIEAALESIVTPRNAPGQGSVHELLLQNAIIETQALVARLRAPRGYGRATGRGSMASPSLPVSVSPSARP